jgi:outer membrane protein OmpA-like peptidoglycan-associated protein
MKRILNTILVSLFIVIYASGQGAKRNLADNYFSYLDYFKAAPIYDELAKQAAKRAEKGKAADWEAVRRAAKCNFYIRNYAKSVAWFDVLDKAKAASREDYMMYFDALRYTAQYNKARVFLDSLRRMDPNDKKVREYLRQANYFDALKRDSVRFKIKQMPFNKGIGDFAASFYNDGLVFVSSRRNASLRENYGWDNLGFLNLYFVKRRDTSFRKSASSQNNRFKTGPHDGPVFYSKDGNIAFITRNRTESDAKKGSRIHLSLYIMQKGSDNKWGIPQPFPYNSNSYNVGHATLSADGNTLYFASDMPEGQGGVDIWKSTRQNGGWSKPVNLGPEFNTSDDEMFPYLSEEGNLYYASKGFVGMGGLDIFESRNNGVGGFIPPINLGYPLNTQYDDFALILEKGGKVGYFSSDRGDYVDRIYGLSMNLIHINLEGTVYSENDKREKVPDARVIIRNKVFGDSIVTQTDSLGRFFAPLTPDSDFEISVDKDGYTPLPDINVNTRGVTESAKIAAEIQLLPGDKPKNRQGEGTFMVRVLDCDTKQPVKGLNLVLQDMETGVETNTRTNENGEITIKQSIKEFPTGKEFAVINEALEMDASGVSYRPAVKKIFFVLKGSETNLTVSKEVCFTKLREGDEMVLEDIYYDFDKWDLRPLSIVQLNKAYDYLMRNQGVKLQLSSHTDSRATYEYNISLSEKRAKSCVDYLVKVKGISSSRLTWKGYGETRLVNGCADDVPCSEEEHQKNRRTEIRVLKLP